MTITELPQPDLRLKAAIALADGTKQHTRTCAKCGSTRTDSDQVFGLLGWGLVRRRLLCPDCMPARLRGY